MTNHLLLLLLVAIGIQDPHRQMNARGAEAMGFDQEATVHHFRLYADGGGIEVAVKDRGDQKNLAAIRAHLPHIAQMLGDGDMSMPHFIHAQNVPGSAEMTAMKSVIVHRYEEMPGGGRVRITTADPKALAALHTFLRFQITDHHTGDSLEVTRTP